MPASVHEPGERLTLALLGAIIVAAALLRLPTLGVQSFWFDEAATWTQVNGTFAEVVTRTAADNYPPLYNLLAWAAVQVLGDAEWVLRLPAAVLGIATVPLLFLLGRATGGRAVGLLAALLLAFSGFHIWYSQEARMYALLAFGATAHGLAALHLLSGRRRGRLALLALTGTVLVYSHPYGALTWIGIGLGAALPLLRRRDWSQLGLLIGAEVAVGLAYLPWAVILVGRAESIADTGFWISAPTPLSVLLHLRQLTGSLIAILLLSPLLLFIRNRLRPGPSGDALVLLLAWAIIPIACGLVASILIEPVFISRYLIGLLPPLLVLVAIVLLSVARSRRAVAVVLSLGLVIGVATWLFGTPRDRTDWRAMLAHASAEMQPTDCIATVFAFDSAIIDYYLRPRPRCYAPTIEAIATLPASARLFLATATLRPEEWEAAAAEAAIRRPVLEMRRLGGNLYTLGPSAP